MSRLRVPFAVAGFIIAALALTPMGFVLSRMDLSASNIAYSSISGTVWNGVIKDVRFGDMRLEDLNVRGRAISLLHGEASADIRSDGPLQSARVSRSLSYTKVQRLNLRTSLRPYFPDLPETASAAVTDGSVVVAENGCSEADGRVDVIGLEPLELPPLTGDLRCEAGDLVARLTSPEAEGRMDLELVLPLDGQDAGQVRARTGSPLVALALQNLGLQVDQR